MKLEGSLDAFSLPDIFQLLSFTKKTRRAAPGQDGSDGVVFFAGGQVTGASADGSRQPLARRLVGSGTRRRTRRWPLRSDRDRRRRCRAWSRALLEQGVIDADLLRQAATDQTVDAVFDLLRWPAGDFAFVVDEANPDDVGVALTVEEVLADAEAAPGRVGRRVRRSFPSPRAVLTMPVVLPADPQVSREEWALLALVDGRRTRRRARRAHRQRPVRRRVHPGRRSCSAACSRSARTPARARTTSRSSVRRQRLLAPLEGEPFAPVQEVAGRADADAAVADADRRRSAIRPVPTATDTRPTLTPGPTRYPMTPDRRRAASARGRQHRAATPTATTSAELATASAGIAGPTMLGGAHVPQDVVPPRPEPFLPRRQADFADHAPDAPAVRRPLQVQAGPRRRWAGSATSVGATATSLGPRGRLGHRT